PAPVLRPQRAADFPYTTLFRSRPVIPKTAMLSSSATSCSFSTLDGLEEALDAIEPGAFPRAVIALALAHGRIELTQEILLLFRQDRKSTRLNSSHVKISYAVFC